jgi:hypothetical protein
LSRRRASGLAHDDDRKRDDAAPLLAIGMSWLPTEERVHAKPFRRITRWQHEDVLDAMQDRLDRTPNTSRLRRQTVEHVFGTLKSWMGSTHFLTETIPRVRTEVSLHVLAYNIKRFISLLGIEAAMAMLKS